MRKYIIKVFNADDALVVQLITTGDDLWDAIDNLSKLGTVKTTLLDEESN